MRGRGPFTVALFSAFYFSLIAMIPFLTITISLAVSGALLFVMTFYAVRIRRSAATDERTLLAAGLLIAGMLAILFAAFVYSINLEDAAPRCIDGCVSSLVQYLQELLASSAILAASGIIATGAGVRLLLRRER